MTPRLKCTIFLFIFSLLSVLPLAAHAQLPSSIDGIQIDQNPDLPSPGQKVNISIESYSTDLHAASIVWLVDNKTYATGVGKTAIDISAPALGKNNVIMVVIKTVEGKEIKKSITLTSGGVDLVWESDGYVPPFYKGKSMFAYQNPIHFIAMPHLAGAKGVELDPKTLVYKWTINDKVIQDQSGYGKQSVTYQDDLPRDLDVVVEVGTPNGSSKATSEITLRPGDPSISFYEEDPLYGVLYNKTLQNTVRLANSEITIRAVPFTFTFSKDNPLTYNWSVNNLERQDLSTNQSITLRTKGDTEGTSAIGISIRNLDQILQGATNGVNVQFAKKPDTTNEVSATFQ